MLRDGLGRLGQAAEEDCAPVSYLVCALDQMSCLLFRLALGLHRRLVDQPGRLTVLSQLAQTLWLL